MYKFFKITIVLILIIFFHSSSAESIHILPKIDLFLSTYALIFRVSVYVALLTQFSHLFLLYLVVMILTILVLRHSHMRTQFCFSLLRTWICCQMS